MLNRYNRCSFERVLACFLQKEGKKETLLGNIHKYCNVGIDFNQVDNYLGRVTFYILTARIFLPR